MARTTIDELLTAARCGLCRLSPAQALAAMRSGALQQLGFAGATDVDGGFQAWREAGLPVTQPEMSER